MKLMLHLLEKRINSISTKLTWFLGEQKTYSTAMSILFLLAPLLMIGCGSAPPVTPTTVPVVFFPKEQPPAQGVERVFLTSLLEGRLIETNGCLRVTNDMGANYLIVWPLEYRVHFEDNHVQILDEINLVVANVGEEVSLGGGEIAFPGQELFEQDHPDLPNSNCPGPYWLASPQNE